MRARSTRCKVASRRVALCRRKSMLPKSTLLKSMPPESMLPKSTLPESPLSRRQGKSWAVRLVFFTVSGAIALALLSHGVTLALAQNQNAQGQSKTASAARRTWLAESIWWKDVAMCGQCHTPRDSNGNPDRTRWLQGAPVPWLPAKPDSDWPLNAPRIGGTPPSQRRRHDQIADHRHLDQREPSSRSDAPVSHGPR